MLNNTAKYTSQRTQITYKHGKLMTDIGYKIH